MTRLELHAHIHGLFDRVCMLAEMPPVDLSAVLSELCPALTSLKLWGRPAMLPMIKASAAGLSRLPLLRRVEIDVPQKAQLPADFDEACAQLRHLVYLAAEPLWG